MHEMMDFTSSMPQRHRIPRMDAISCEVVFLVI